jgi:hypothetical protein
VIDVEPLIRAELERLVPAPVHGRADWDDVLHRSGTRPRLARRPLVLAFAAAVAVLAAATAVATTLGGFDRWLRGSPGKPAPASVQRLFEAANGRSWAAFPRGTKLRELVRTRVGRRTFVLYGFRSGTTLCLRLDGGSRRERTQACAPASTLTRISSPVLVVVADQTFYDSGNRPSAQVSFGIAADGVSRVDVDATDGRHRALVGGNAYLFVGDEPNTGNRVRAISAVGPTGSRTRLAFVGPRWPFDRASTRRPPGPTRLEARITNPRIGWHLRGEHRGGPRGFVKPDPLSDTLVGLEGEYCLAVVTGGTGEGRSCSAGRSFFTLGPLNFMITRSTSEFMGVHGAVADGVRRVTIFMADGTRQPTALRHNLFTALVPAAPFPIRIVAYDARGRVVGIVVPPGLGSTRPIPPSARRLVPRLRVRGPNGAVALLRVGRRVRGYRCWRVDFSTGQSPGGCPPPIAGGPRTHVELVQQAGRDLFVIGVVNDARPPTVTRVQLEFENGGTRRARVAAGHFVVAVPRAHLSRERQQAFLVAYNEFGSRTLRQRVFFKVRG